jgi:hypothetical protein
MYLTEKQFEIIRVVNEGNEDGTQADLDEIIERVSYKPSKASIQFSIRALIEHGLIEKLGIEKRRNRHRAVIGATSMGQYFANSNSPSVAKAILEPTLD